MDDISIKGCKKEARDLTLDADGCKRFVKDYLKDIKKILKRLEKWI